MRKGKKQPQARRVKEAENKAFKTYERIRGRNNASKMLKSKKGV